MNTFRQSGKRLSNLFRVTSLNRQFTQFTQNQQQSKRVGLKMVLAVSTTIVALSSSTYYANSQKKFNPNELGNLYMWGNNKNKIIPDGEEVVKKPKRIPFFDNSTIKSLSVSTTHVAVVDKDNKVYRWGWIGGQHYAQPTLWTSGAIQVACGESQAYALGTDGKVFILKNDDNGKASKGIQGSEILMPSNLKKEKIVKISAGHDHIVALTDKGNLLTFSPDTSKLNKGQLGIEKTEQLKDTWNHVKINQKVVDIACGNNHSVALTDNSKVYGFGSNDWGQLAQGHYESSTATISEPTELKFKNNPQLVIKKIAAGGNNTFIITEDENESIVFSVGNGQYGQLGHGKNEHMNGHFVQVTEISGRQYYDETKKKLVPTRIGYVSIGQTHAAAVLNTYLPNSGFSSGDSVYSWGYNKNYELHTGNRATTSTPLPARNIEEAEEEVVDVETNMQLTHNDGKFRQTIVCGNELTAVYTTTR